MIAFGFASASVRATARMGLVPAACELTRTALMPRAYVLARTTSLAAASEARG
jgi:hypothetical protein